MWSLDVFSCILSSSSSSSLEVLILSAAPLMNMASYCSTEAYALYAFVAILSQTRIVHARHTEPSLCPSGTGYWNPRARERLLSPGEPTWGVQGLPTAPPYHQMPLALLPCAQADIQSAGYIRWMAPSHERTRGVVWARGGVSSEIYSVSLENWFLFLSRKACWLKTTSWRTTWLLSSSQIILKKYSASEA